MPTTQQAIREARRTDTRARLLHAAWALAREHGVAAVSLRELATEVGMRQPSLYTYFESKNGLYDLMYEAAGQELLTRATALSPTADPVADLRAIVGVLVEFSTEDVARHDLVFHRPIPGYEPSAEAAAPAQRFRELLVRRVESAGITDPGDIDVVTAAIAGLVEAQIASEPTGDRWTRHVDRVLDALRTGLAPRKPKKRAATR
ncbi:MAG: TetR/AcrR family transcriptional regulator [Acidimicrobiia bacterium]